MDELLVKLRKIYPTNYAEIKKAHDFAEEAHRGQKRSSGEDYFIHPCAVVEILADFGFDSSTVIAAFLHDVLEDTSVTYDELKENFGDEICELVEGVTKLDKLQFVNREEAQAENFRKIFVAMAKDLSKYRQNPLTSKTALHIATFQRHKIGIFFAFGAFGRIAMFCFFKYNIVLSTDDK